MDSTLVLLHWAGWCVHLPRHSLGNCWWSLLSLCGIAVSATAGACVVRTQVEVFEDYFNELVEESIRDNFVITYELLDEMMDFGYPQSTEPKVLKEYICVEERHKFVAKPPVAVTNAVSWRGEGIKHKKNEIFLDVIEKLNILVSANGTVLRSEILGSLKMKSFLSGMPELKLGLNDKVLMDSSGRAGADPSKGKSVDLEDIRFHQCVRLSRFENDRTISFIPPDGEFDLMVYRLNTQVRPLIWIEAHVEPHSHSRIEYMIKAKSNFKRRSTANNVEIVIPVPTDADSPQFKSSIGKVEYVPEKNAIIWKIKQFQVRWIGLCCVPCRAWGAAGWLPRRPVQTADAGAVARSRVLV